MTADDEALPRPQDETADVEGIDIVVAFDMSGSMQSIDISDADLVKLNNAGEEPRDRFTSGGGGQCDRRHRESVDTR